MFFSSAGCCIDPERFERLLKSNQLAMAYVVHDKRSINIPRLAPKVKEEIATALAAALGITIQPHEVQPVLDACRRNYSTQTWDPKACPPALPTSPPPPQMPPASSCTPASPCDSLCKSCTPVQNPK